MDVSPFYGYVSMKTGAFIIGILHFIASLVALVFACIQPLSYIYIIPTVIQLAVAVVLLFGAHNSDPYFLLLFLCGYSANIIGIIPIMLTVAIAACFSLFYVTWFIIAVVVIAFVVLPLSIYFFMVIFNFYHELLEESFGRKTISRCTRNI